MPRSPQLPLLLPTPYSPNLMTDDSNIVSILGPNANFSYTKLIMGNCLMVQPIQMHISYPQWT